MNPPVKQNKTIRSVILIFAIVFIFWTLYQEKRPIKASGQLEFRMITGVVEGSFQIIMLETADRFFVLDSAFRNSFEENDAEVVTRQEQLSLLSKYDDLQYRAGFSVGINGKEQTQQLRTTRDLFNMLTFERNLLLKTDAKVIDSLLAVTVIQ